TVFVATVNFALCPSDGQNRLTNASGYSGKLYGPINYVASSGAVAYRKANPCDGIYCRVDGVSYDGNNGHSPGVFYCQAPATGTPVSIAMVTDGLSNTAAWSERVKGIGYKTSTVPTANVDPITPSTTLWYIPTIATFPSVTGQPSGKLFTDASGG